MWERACSRIGRYIQPIYKLTHRHREQARSHRGIVADLNPETTGDQLWERACSRIGSYIQPIYKLTLRHREQARFHRGILWRTLIQ